MLIVLRFQALKFEYEKIVHQSGTTGRTFETVLQTKHPREIFFSNIF